jgi:polyisoprenoid-binding protein YceI
LRRSSLGARAQLAEPLDITTRADTRQVTLVPPGTWEVDSERSTVCFEVRHLKISRVRGCFREVTAVVSCDSEGVGSVEASISVASIDTGDPRRDARLCAQDFFDAEHHATAYFRGAAPPMAEGKVLAVRGMMTLRGALRPVELLAEPSRAADGKGDGDRWIRARGFVSRREFGLDWDSAFAAGGLVIDDRVALRLDVALRRARSA